MHAYPWIFIAFLLLPLSSAEAAVYRCTGEDGKVNYSDRPCGDDAKELNVPSGGSSSGAASESDRWRRQQNLLRAYDEERAKEKEEAAQREQAERERARKCVEARDQLRGYESAGYLYDLDEKGNRRVLSDAERERVMNQVRAAVTEWCE